jgi:hypothetical protein
VLGPSGCLAHSWYGKKNTHSNNLSLIICFVMHSHNSFPQQCVAGFKLSIGGTHNLINLLRTELKIMQDTVISNTMEQKFSFHMPIVQCSMGREALIEITDIEIMSLRL